MGYSDKAKQSRYQADRLFRLKAEWLAANGPCRHCGGSENLEVDHIDPSTKESHYVWSWSPERRAKELAKCQVLCHDCHREKSNGELRRPLVHGTPAGYKHHGCRCGDCLAALKAQRGDRWGIRREAPEIECQGCGALFRYAGMGRPHVYCENCRA